MTNTETPAPARVMLSADDWEMVKTSLAFTAESLAGELSADLMRIFHAISAVTGYTED